MSYTLIRGNPGVVRNSDNARIPADPNNSDWQTYLAWRAAGNAPTPAPLPDAAEEQYEVDRAAARNYAKLTALRAMSPAQVQAWAAANVLNFADARDVIVTLAIAVSVLTRKL